MNWFYYYNGGEYSLVENCNVTPRSYPVCKEINGKKRFALFSSCFELYRHIIFLKKEERCLYEYIRGEIPQKPYFDIDINLEEETGFFDRDEKISISDQLITILINSIIKIRPEILMTDILVFNSHSDSKRSFHVVVDRWMFLNAKQNKKFFDEVILEIPQPWRSFLDSSMYSSLQQFRLYMCTKYGKTRFKKLDPIKSKWIIEDDIPDDRINERIFYGSLVTRVEGCNLLQGYEEESYTFESVEIEREHIVKIHRMIKNLPDSNCYQITENRETMIILKRIHPSRCDKCSQISGHERIHESENPYVRISKSGNVYFDCRRGSKTLIGNINDDQFVEVKKKVLPYKLTKPSETTIGNSSHINDQPIIEEKNNDRPIIEEKNNVESTVKSIMKIQNIKSIKNSLLEKYSQKTETFL